MPLALAAMALATTVLVLSCDAEPARAFRATSEPSAWTCHRPTVVDGDTIRCNRNLNGQTVRVKVRLLGIDAPELGKCRKGRVCVAGDPMVSRNLLADLLTQPPVTVQPFGKDRYGRTLGIVRVGRDGTNVACALLASGSVIYKPNWDKANRIGKECRVKGGVA